MKAKTLALAAGVGGTLLLGAAAEASFVGIAGESIQRDVAGVTSDVWRVYVVFDNSTDTVEAVFGDLVGNNLLITTNLGTFYQDALGTDVDHLGALDAIPSVIHDTYVTIGSFDSSIHGQTQQQGVSTPIGPGFGPSSLSLTNGSWFRTPGDPATQGIAQGDGTWRVAIGQFTIERGARLDGLINIAGSVNGGQATTTGITFNLTTIPAPGAIALLGLAGILGGRRRRR